MLINQLQLPDPEPISDWCPDWIDNLVYGPSGTGKTVYTSTWPKPIIYLDTDNGMLSIARTAKNLDGISKITITDQSPDKHIAYPVGWITLKQIIKIIIDTGEYFGIAPATIVTDSITTASRFAMTYVQYQNKRLGQRPVLQDWGDQMAELTDMIGLGVATKCNFVCVAHEQFQKDELSGRVWCLPMTTGKLAGQISLYFDEVYHTKLGLSGTQTTYLLETKASGPVTAKSILDLPSPINATYDEIAKTLATIKSRQPKQPTAQPPAQSTQPQPPAQSWVAKT